MAFVFAAIAMQRFRVTSARKTFTLQKGNKLTYIKIPQVEALTKHSDDLFEGIWMWRHDAGLFQSFRTSSSNRPLNSTTSNFYISTTFYSIFQIIHNKPSTAVTTEPSRYAMGFSFIEKSVWFCRELLSFESFPKAASKITIESLTFVCLHVYSVEARIWQRRRGFTSCGFW